MQNPRNSNYKQILWSLQFRYSKFTKPEKHNISICNSWEGYHFLPQQNLLTLTLSLLDNKSAVCCEWRGGALCSLCLNRWRNWLRKVICLWSHSLSPGSRCIMSRAASRLRDGRGTAARSRRWPCVTSNERCGKNIHMRCTEEGLFKMWQAKGQSGKLSTGWQMSYNLDLDDVQ